MVYHRLTLLQGPNCLFFFFFLTVSPWRATEYLVSLYTVSLVCKNLSVCFLSNSSFCNNMLCSLFCIQLYNAMQSSVIDWAGKKTKVCVWLGFWPAPWSWVRLLILISSALKNIRTLLKNMWCCSTQIINIWLQSLLEMFECSHVVLKWHPSETLDRSYFLTQKS